MTLREILTASVNTTLDEINESLEEILTKVKDKNYTREDIATDIERLLKLID